MPRLRVRTACGITLNQPQYHLITSEYPPQPGGVSDYTQMVATELAAAGDQVHVWCPRTETLATNGESNTDAPGVFVHRELGGFKPADLRRFDSLLDKFSPPRRLLVQWVPHGYGYRSMNLPFCLWLRRRALRHRDAVEMMVHEPYLSFGEGSLKQDGVAAVHRLMTMVLLDAAKRVWVSIPAWEARWRPYALRRRLPFQWLPVASNIAVVDDPKGVEAVRARYAPDGGHVVGHFGSYDRHIAKLLLQSLPSLLRSSGNSRVLLLGHGSETLRDDFVRAEPELGPRVHAAGTLAAKDLSLHISACDVLLQPYIDGVSSRRTSAMVGLAHGVPIATTTGRMTEPLWAESNAVALVPVGDIPALLSIVEQVLGDADCRGRMSAAARKLYDKHFDVKRTITALREPGI